MATVQDVPEVRAGRELAAAPEWARLERELFAALDRAWPVFSARYTEGDGRLVFRDKLGEGHDDRDGVDDFYEPFFNWPTLYLLGGSAEILDAAHRHWRGVTAQLTEMGMVVDGIERGYDWFHQGEGLLLYYALCLARPDDAELRDLAVRFADLYLPGGPNYSAEHRVIRAPHTGAVGPRWGFSDHEEYFPWSEALRPYGLPLDWLGITEFDDLKDPAKARAYGREMWERMGRGDVVVNLAVTSLVTTAFLLTGEQRYADWVAEYVGTWLSRLEDREVLPDNAGLHGEVGEHLDGRWYGGHYGWAWPHGLNPVGTATLVAAMNAVLLTGDESFLDLARNPQDAVLKQAEPRTGSEMGTLKKRWQPHLRELDGRPTLMVPQRHDDSGWFDYNIMPTQLPVSLWQFSRNSADFDRVERLRAESTWDWTTVHTQRLKDEAGHEEPWFEYLHGRNPEFPERMLRSAFDSSAAKLAAIEQDPLPVPSALDIHHWQDHNPVVTEALLQLTTGSPQILYNGGLAQLHLRYFDADLCRAGLPEDVAALVSDIATEHTVVDLVNLGTTTRNLVLQSGTFAEHRLESVRVDDAPAIPLNGRYLRVELPPSSAVQLTLSMTLRASTPTMRAPWENER